MDFGGFGNLLNAPMVGVPRKPGQEPRKPRGTVALAGARPCAAARAGRWHPTPAPRPALVGGGRGAICMGGWPCVHCAGQSWTVFRKMFVKEFKVL